MLFILASVLEYQPTSSNNDRLFSDIVSVLDMLENKMKVKVNSNIHPNILSEIMILRENGGCGERLAQVSN